MPRGLRIEGIPRHGHRVENPSPRRIGTSANDVECARECRGISNAGAGPRRQIVLARRIHPPEIVDKQRLRSWPHCQWKVFAKENRPPNLLPRRAVRMMFATRYW